MCWQGPDARIISWAAAERRFGARSAGRKPLQETNYEVLDDLLQRANAECDAAECHGALSGIACSGEQGGVERWLVQLTGDLDPADAGVAECRAMMLRVYRNCCAELESDQLPFAPLLPDESESLSVRTAALGRWCQGFLFGLSLGGLPDLENLSTEVEEIIHDLSEITRAGIDEHDDSEQSERDYVEIVEFVRVCVQLVNEELQPPVRQHDARPTLH